MKLKALAILGPTCSGKSALAVQLGLKAKIEIISLDSALIYRGMDIGTAKPSFKERAAVPHHLIDICDPKESYSAQDFRTDCIALVDEILGRGALPVICGGTMMYYKALTDGLSALPAADPAVRERVRQEGERQGWEAMHEKLKEFDLPSYLKLAPKDKQRVSRAVEIYYQTGRSMSDFLASPKEPCPFLLKEYVIMPKEDRSDLRVLIGKRFFKMLKEGLIEEVQALRARGDLDLTMPSLRCVGYRQVWEYLEGLCSYDEMVQKAVIATARLAKHQMTWLRGSLKGERTLLSLSDPKSLDLLMAGVKEAGQECGLDFVKAHNGQPL